MPKTPIDNLNNNVDPLHPRLIRESNQMVKTFSNVNATNAALGQTLKAVISMITPDRCK